MKNVYIHLTTAVISLLLTIAAAFLMTAADAPIREAGMYLSIFFGAVFTLSSAAALLSRQQPARRTKTAY